MGKVNKALEELKEELEKFSKTNEIPLTKQSFPSHLREN
jgi:hypothetical protein